MAEGGGGRDSRAHTRSCSHTHNTHTHTHVRTADGGKEHRVGGNHGLVGFVREGVVARVQRRAADERVGELELEALLLSDLLADNLGGRHDLGACRTCRGPPGRRQRQSPRTRAAHPEQEADGRCRTSACWGAARESPRLTDAVAGQGGDLVGVLLVDDHPERGRSRRVGAARHRRGEDGRKAESRRTCNQGKGENGPARRERHGRQRQRAARAAQADASRVAPIAPPGSRRRASDARGSAPRGYRPHCRRRAARDHGATAIAAHAAVAAPDAERCALRAMRPQARPPCAPTLHWWALVEAPWRNRPAAARRTRCFACAPGARAWALHLRISRKRPRAEKRRSRIFDLESIFSNRAKSGGFWNSWRV